jgi:hypothetical protein
MYALADTLFEGALRARFEASPGAYARCIIAACSAWLFVEK